jgi:hypothetical protein
MATIQEAVACWKVNLRGIAHFASEPEPLTVGYPGCESPSLDGLQIPQAGIAVMKR